DAARLRPYRSDLRIEDYQDRDEVPRVADRDRLADDRARLRERLQVGGRDVLARGGDDQLLLAVDDLELPVRPRLGDVAAVDPAVGGDHVRGLAGLLVVPDHDGASAAPQLSAFAQPTRNPRAPSPR